jgi:hypothetical protein
MTKESLTLTDTSQLGPAQTADARVPTSAVVLLVLSALVGILSVAGTYAFLHEYGTTSGSWIDGAVGGVKFAAVPLLIVGALAGVAFFLGRQATWVVRAMAAALVVLAAGGAMVAGGQAALARYDRLPKVPFCGTETHMTGARAAEAAFAEIEHPAPFGGGWYGVNGCGATVLNVTFAEAAEHYREHLPAAGWRITGDTSHELAARRNDLLFVLFESCGTLEVEMSLVAAGANPNRC